MPVMEAVSSGSRVDHPSQQQPESPNFAFMREHDPLLLQLCAAAERYCITDPNTTLLKLRQFGEAIAQHLAAAFGLDAGAESGQADLLAVLQRRGHLDRDIADLLHTLRREGNEAAHRFQTAPRQAKEGLRTARTLAIWFHRAFGRNTRHFKPGPFQDVEPAWFAPAPPRAWRACSNATRLRPSRNWHRSPSAT